MAATKRAKKKAPKAPRAPGKAAPAAAAEVPGDAPPGAAEAGKASVKKARKTPAGRAAPRAPKKTVPEDDAGVEKKGIKRGDRVQVLKGEYGNTRGTVVGIDRMAIGVVLDNRVRQPALPFLRSALKRC